jgi:hypothetical protein
MLLKAMLVITIPTIARRISRTGAALAKSAHEGITRELSYTGGGEVGQ